MRTQNRAAFPSIRQGNNADAPHDCGWTPNQSLDLLGKLCVGHQMARCLVAVFVQVERYIHRACDATARKLLGGSARREAPRRRAGRFERFRTHRNEPKWKTSLCENLQSISAAALESISDLTCDGESSRVSIACCFGDVGFIQ